MPNLHRELIDVLADGAFHSGTALSRQLGLSRSAIWKHIQALGEVGLVIHAVRGRGYRLAHPLERLDADLIRAQLDPAVQSHIPEIAVDEVVDSTNRRLLQAPKVAPGTVALAEFQTAGRGRLGHRWLAPFGGSVCLSVSWQFEEARVLNGLSLAMAVGLIRALSPFDIKDLALKWPNDLYHRDKKLGGILLEMSGEAHGQCRVVIGIGLNLSLPDSLVHEIDQPATDLRRVIVGPLPGRNRLVAALLNALIPILLEFPTSGLAPFLDEWRASHGFLGRAADLRIGEASYGGIIEDVTAEGLLLFRTDQGEQRRVSAGDVRLRVRR